MEDKLIKKLQGLNAKAVSAKEIGNIEEAAAFAAKFQELLTKHNLEKTDLNLNGNDPKAEGEWIDLNKEHGLAKTDGKWLQRLYGVVARANFGNIVVHGNCITLIAEKHNVEAIQYMVTSLATTIKHLRLQRWKEYHGPDKMNAFKRGYYMGAVQGINTKLSEQREKDMVKYDGLPGLVVTQNKLVEDKMFEMFGKLGTSRSSRLSGSGGLAAGRKDGRTMSVNKGVSGRSSNTLRLG